MSKEKYVNNLMGMMKFEDLLWLLDSAKQMDSVVEIGCWGGRSTHALLTGCNGIVHAVDHFMGSSYDDTEPDRILQQLAANDNIYNKFVDRVGYFPNLKIHRMESMKAVRKFKKNSIDMVFIDGCHRYKDVCDDINGWLPKTVKLICGHDIAHGPVKKAVSELIGEYKVTTQNIWYKWL